MNSPGQNSDEDFITSINYHKQDDLEESKDELSVGLQKYSTDESSDNSTDSGTGSNLSTIPDKSEYFSSKVSYQRRALIRKSISLQLRQIGTNVCQLLTPIISLLLIILLKSIAQSRLSESMNAPIYSGLPYIFNIPLVPVGQLGLLFNLSNCDQWYMYGFQDDVDQETRDFFGYNKGTPIFDPESKGILDGDKNVLQTACPSSERATPYFKEKNASETINQYLFNTLEHLNTQKINYKDMDSEVPDIWMLPDGAFNVYKANESRLKYNVQVNDLRYIQYHRNNGVTKLGIQNPLSNKTSYFINAVQGQISAVDLMNKAYISKLFPNTFIYSGVQIMPISFSFDQEIMKVINMLGGGLFPISLCLMLPVFIYNIVLEKEQKLVEIMKMNGLRMRNYWIITFIFNFILYFITCFVFIMFGRFVLGLTFFYETSYLVLIIFLLGWGLSQISLGFFFSAFLRTAQTASMLGYLISIWVTLVAVSLNITLFAPPQEVSWWLLLYPTFPYTRFFFEISTACGLSSCIRSFNDLSPEATRCLWILYVEAAVFMIFAFYFQQVIPQDYGVPKHPLFCCRALKYKKKSSITTREKIEFLNRQESDLKNIADDSELAQLEDDDAKKERKTVYELHEEDYYKYPLIVKDIRKVYPGIDGRPPKVATKKFCLKIKKGEVFGLLGPNGAGKTTLISMLTGLYRPDSGNAWTAGFDIKNNLEQIQLQMGVCPQFDILWPDLTVQEHLLFYARLKGISPKEESSMVKEAMQDVFLEKFAKFKVDQLSGGMKRRLSVAISLVGDPKIVYLDEPSTGLDPENRRQLWDILSGIKGKRSLVITTHSMEEADVLCQRIGIVSDGVLRCVGPQVRLKTLYGGGYHLFVNCHKSKYLRELKREAKRRAKASSHNTTSEESKIKMEINKTYDLNQIHLRLKEFIQETVPNVYLLQEFNGNFTFQIPIEGFDAEKLFLEMESNKEDLMISDWGISQCTLDDVFTKICTPKEN